jgi:uncharacterized protein
MVDKLLVKNFQKRCLLFIAGFFSMSLGILGIFLPLLPTTPFLLLAAYCFVRSSHKMYNWLLHNKLFGHEFKSYLITRAVSLKIKVWTVVILWVTILTSMYFVSIVYVRIILLIVAVSVSIHIYKLKTLSKGKLGK